MTVAEESVRNPLLRTALHALHGELGARMVPFACYELPLQFVHGIRHEHLRTRSHATLFDVSHMGQIRLYGERAPEQLQQLVPADLTGLAPYRQCYTVFTNGDGGILDDLMVTRLPDGLFLVVNAARKDADLEHLRGNLPADCMVESLPDRALLALQGPLAATVLAGLNPGVHGLKFLHAGEFKLGGSACLVHRCGYTGEDGFEISLPAAAAETLARHLLQHEAVEPAGLGARDSLRLEAGLCLHGHDIDATTTPVEAGLGWLVAKKYRGGARACFPGAARILAELEAGTARKRVGLRPDGPPVREGRALEDLQGKRVGHVTSGSYGPSLAAPVAMGYVAAHVAVPGTALQVEVRGRTHAATVSALPFIPHHYRH